MDSRDRYQRDQRKRDLDDVQLGDIMSTNVHVVAPHDGVMDAATRMRDTGVACLVVADGRRVHGVVRDRDLALGCLLGRHDFRRCQVARHIKPQAVTAPPDTDLRTAVHLLNDNLARYIIVVDGGVPVGLVSLPELAQALGVPHYQQLAATARAQEIASSIASGGQTFHSPRLRLT